MRGNTTAGSASTQTASPPFEFVHTPVHASWVTQIEFQRRVIRHGSFEHQGRIKQEVEAFACE
ncbi:MAG: hypothetical protein KC766_21945 [Myxococcales bacterium]|nr:hypothetical protein [Myxococcales bacterium]